MVENGRSPTCHAVRAAAGVLAIPEQWEPRVQHLLSYTHRKVLHIPQRDAQGRTHNIDTVSRDIYVKDAGYMIVAYGARHRVEEGLIAQGIRMEVLDNIPPLQMNEESLGYALRGIELREGQAEALAIVADADRAQIVAPTGWGKSFTIRLSAAMFPEARIVVATPSVAICSKMYRELLRLLPCVGMVGGGKDEQNNRILVCTYASLEKACLRRPDILFIDECHGAAAADMSEVLLSLIDVRKIFGFTATPVGRSDGAELVTEAICGPILLDVTYQDGVASGAVLPMRVHVKHVTDRDVSELNIPHAGMSRIQKKRCCYWNNAGRDAAIADGIDDVLKIIGLDAQVLVLVETAEHALRLGKILPDYALVLGDVSPRIFKKLAKERVITADFMPPSPARIEELQKDFETGKLRKAIATGKWSIGVDFKGLNLIVPASGDVSGIRVPQSAGRASRTDGIKVEGHVLDTMDDFASWPRDRSRERLRIYRKLGWVVPRQRRCC